MLLLQDLLCIEDLKEISLRELEYFTTIKDFYSLKQKLIHPLLLRGIYQKQILCLFYKMIFTLLCKIFIHCCNKSLHKFTAVNKIHTGLQNFTLHHFLYAKPHMVFAIPLFYNSLQNITKYICALLCIHPLVLHIFHTAVYISLLLHPHMFFAVVKTPIHTLPPVRNIIKSQHAKHKTYYIRFPI